MTHRIVIAVDGSDNSRRAVAYVGELVGRTPGLEVTLLHVIHAPDENFFPNGQERERWLQSGRSRVEGWLAEYRRMLLAAGMDPARVSVHLAERDGPSLAALILAETCALDAGTIVVGRQGLSPREELLFGSVSRQVVGHASNRTVWVVG